MYVAAHFLGVFFHWGSPQSWRGATEKLMCGSFSTIEIELVSSHKGGDSPFFKTFEIPKKFERR